jgi:rubrerythrin
MFLVSPETFFAAVFVTAVAVIFGAWFWDERRRATFYDLRAIKTSFHCVKCSALYLVNGRPASAPCPHCGFQNGRLQF